MYAKAIIALFLSILSVDVVAQTRFSVDDTARFVSGGTSWGVLHHFIQANNHVGDTLQMRWRKTVKRNPPASWQVNFADPESNHPNIALLDSVDFIFPDSATNHTYNKFVIGVDPNGVTGSGQYIFTISERQHPADSIRIIYNVEVYTSVSLEDLPVDLRAFPNPAEDYIYIPSLSPGSRLSLRDLFGREVPLEAGSQQGARLTLPRVPSGYYLLKIVENNKVQVIKISIQN